MYVKKEKMKYVWNMYVKKEKAQNWKIIEFKLHFKCSCSLRSFIVDDVSSWKILKTFNMDHLYIMQKLYYETD
jgi:hypothetical protein